MFPKLVEVIAYLDSLNQRANLSLLEQILLRTEVAPEDVASACKFNDAHYTRNKIAAGEWYDFYVMCWRPGQASAIHDHTDSSCAFKILEGVATEIACELTNPEKRLVRETKVTLFTTEECCVAQDNQIHQIVNASPAVNLVTLHIYSPPLKMGVYEIDPAEQANIRRSA
jgi:predicted metal-dependent enzyme (double-stranded beta helix superfamily)